jgi:hypothetical protein
MMDFMRAGGFGIWVVLLFGLITLGTAVLFAWRPDERRLSFIRAMTLATAFQTVAATVSGFGAVGFKVPSTPAWAESPKVHLIVMEGIAESLTNSMLGFTLLAVAWLVTAIGIRRLAARLAA